MGFVLIQNGKPLGHENIKWKFVGRDGEFVSMPEKIERNIAYWRNKIGTDAEVEYLNVKTEVEHDEPIISELAIESVVESNDSIIAEEPSVPQDTKDSVNTPKRKPRKKTS